MTDLIVDFPQQSQRNRRVVRFADTAQLRIVQRHEDNQRHKVARHELWYTKSESDLMKLAIKRDVRQVRVQALAGAHLTHAVSRNDDASAEESTTSCIGIEHLITPAWTLEVKACRARCKRAVLAEQAKQDQDPSARFRWEAIALASLAQTRTAASRARKLGKLHLDSSKSSC